MDIALASIITCVNSVKILPQESSVKTACQVITGIRLMEDSAQRRHGEGGSAGGGSGRGEKRTSCGAGSPVQGSIPGCWDHDLT